MTTRPPHFHVRYGGQRAIVAIETLAVIEGTLSPRVRVDPELGTVTWPRGADLCPDVLRRMLAAEHDAAA